MSSRISDHLRGNLVGYVALFVALSGTAYAVDGSLPGQNTVGSEDIMNGEVLNPDLGINSVGTGKVIDKSLVGADIKDDSITGVDISAIGGADVTNGSLTGQDVANNQLNADDVFGLGTADINDGSLTSADVANQSLTGTDIAYNSINADDVFGLRGDDDIADNSLTGADIDESTLSGCQSGSVASYALIRGSADLPDATEGPTSDPAFVREAWTCTGSPVTVSRGPSSTTEGQYWVTMPGHVFLANSSVDSPNTDSAVSDLDNFVSIDQKLGLITQVHVRDDDGGSEHGWFWIVGYFGP